MSGTIHVIPRNDTIEHETGGECPCGPEVRPCPQPDGSMAWMVVHASLDGREATE